MTWNCSGMSSVPGKARFFSSSGPACTGNRDAFSRLEQAMRRTCAQQEPREQLDRWLAEGYWYLSVFVPGHISHQDFPRPEAAEYYEAAVKRLQDLQNWFIAGRSPYLPSYQWPDL